MKINKWTMGLAAVGLISLASVQAEEKTAVLTALSSTTVSGYVDTSAHWNPGTGSGGAGYAFNAGKNDGFNVNSVLISLEKPLEEGEWSAGYRADIQLGPDAAVILPGGAPIRQAYVALRVPVGNGLDFKLGRFDALLGYESSDGYKNPNYTRSYEYTLTPTEHTGLLATYQALDYLTVNAGIANTAATTAGSINARNTRGPGLTAVESQKAYMASVAITAPDSWGFLSGSAFYAGVLDGFAGPGTTTDFTQYYLGATIATPVEGLRVGAAYSFFDNVLGKGTDTFTANAYLSFKATEKLAFHVRGEYAQGNGNVLIPGPLVNGKILAVTGTVQYDLWENVLSRLEVRWDHDATGSAARPFNSKRNDYLIAANIIYKF